MMSLVEVLRKKAPGVPASLYEAKDFADAMQYAVDVTLKKRACEMLMPVAGEQYGPESENGIPTQLVRHIAVPGFSDEEFAALNLFKSACHHAIVVVTTWVVIPIL